MKLDNDKYYTPISLANRCISKTISIIGRNNITEIIEPSVGGGSFLHHPTIKIDKAYDIYPECTSNTTQIKQSNFLTEPLTYKKGRLVIGNPPYGSRLADAQRFYKKSTRIADYIAFILPISQLNNTSSMYEFDLIYSEDLGVTDYSGRDLHCCFNIYKRPIGSKTNKRKLTKLDAVKIYRYDSDEYEDVDYDIRMCYWGNGTIGKILKPNEHYAAEYKIKVTDNKYKNDIIRVLKTFDWKGYKKGISMKRLSQQDIINVLIQEIPELQTTSMYERVNIYEEDD